MQWGRWLGPHLLEKMDLRDPVVDKNKEKGGKKSQVLNNILKKNPASLCLKKQEGFF